MAASKVTQPPRARGVEGEGELSVAPKSGVHEGGPRETSAREAIDPGERPTGGEPEGIVSTTGCRSGRVSQKA